MGTWQNGWKRENIYIKSYLRKVTCSKTVIFLVPLRISLPISFWCLFSGKKKPHMHTPKTSENVVKSLKVAMVTRVKQGFLVLSADRKCSVVIIFDAPARLLSTFSKQWLKHINMILCFM